MGTASALPGAMRRPVFVLSFSLATACILAASPSRADEPAVSAPAEPAPVAPVPASPPPAPEATPSPVQPDVPKPSAADEGPTERTSGLRLGLDLSFGRGASGGEEAANAGSPSVIPLGLDASWRTSARVLFGVHGHAALASRSDCSTDQDCTGRDYAFGPHVEATLSKNGSMVPWFRYGIGWEMLYRGGLAAATDGYAYRHALNVLDARLGVDFVVARSADGRTTRIGPYVGMIGGILLAHAGAFTINSTRYDFDRGGGDASFWFLIGFRATTDL